MQLDVFSTDSEKNGFRLQYMEILNWGTFDGTIHTIRPMGETSLLTGANGSGKTTFVDALLTLIVPEKRYRFYNQSSGSEKKGDRTEDSYVLGGFGTINNEANGTSKTEYLREDKSSAYSILLVHFANETGQEVTLFQVRHYLNGEMKKYFGIAHKALLIENDFKPFDLTGNWKRNIDQRYNKGARKQVEWFDAASKYAQRMVEVLGMQSMQALQLFNQTVGIKVLGNLDEFIRQNMLEPRNTEEEFDALKKQLVTLLDAQRNIEKSEAQISMLTALKEQYERFRELQIKAGKNKELLETAQVWERYTHGELLKTAISELNDLIRLQHGRQTAIKASIQKYQQEEQDVNFQIQHNKAGQRLKALETEIAEKEKELASTQQELSQFSKWCEDLKLTVTVPETRDLYQQIKKENNTKLRALENEKRLNEEDDFEAKNRKRAALEDKEQLEQQLNSLQHSKNNIDYHLINLRKQICDELNIDITRLPFAGELMQVRSEEMIWQPALEKLLRPFALRMLVPDKYYKKVNKYVNNNHLRARLVYTHVLDTPLHQHMDEGTVPEKLEFHPDHELSDWLEQETVRTFRTTCLEDEKHIERYENAITLNGLIKNGKRHEKDDRPDRNDPSRYVLGWNNENKKEALLKKRAVAVEVIASADEIINRCASKNKRLATQFYHSQRIDEHPAFDSLNLKAITASIQNLKKQTEALRQSNEALDALKKQLQQILQSRAEADNLHESLIEEGAQLKMRKEQYDQEAASLKPLLERLTVEDKDRLLSFQQQHSGMLGNPGLADLRNCYESFRALLEKDKDVILDNLSKAEKQVMYQIGKIKRPSPDILTKYPDWGGDVQQLPDDPGYAAEYMEWLETLATENLPKYRRDFESFINITITHKIAGLKEALDKWERDIDTSVKRLNESLAAINFNRLPDTYIQLGKRVLGAGTEIREFRQRLLEALPQAANWAQESFEAKALHFTEKVQPLINDLDKDENYRRKVLDVRNWFEFWADERYRGNNEPKKTYKQMGQLSGGEKAQLTYTILCSAIAYQFGITREGKNSRSLRFIAVDESFSNQDEEKATYLMELCRELHLQLLVVTPSDKIQIVQDFIAHVHLVQRVGHRHSTLYNMTKKELIDRMKSQDETTN
ncbi:ATP-binding protein [Chitinophaga rhizosphaerae]|uniref:ATP-binding protein n=1 Tax=Chitinophaga rhizosphaerae TaxID=1864947 RepID=UPI000F80AF10|nr:SbcC/MukB-like Walker B domain-containing protein [Chitinophaga rhizosphaerae]